MSHLSPPSTVPLFPRIACSQTDETDFQKTKTQIGNEVKGVLWPTVGLTTDTAFLDLSFNSSQMVESLPL